MLHCILCSVQGIFGQVVCLTDCKFSAETTMDKKEITLWDLKLFETNNNKIINRNCFTTGSK